MEWQITEKESGMMIREFLADIAQFSKRLVIKAKSAEGQILVNGKKQTVRYELHPGDLLEVILPDERIGTRMAKEKIPLSIVYEDDHMLVVDKPAQMATIPSRHHPRGTLANGILYYYAEKNLPYTVHIVTRLDRETSGLVLVAKNQYSHSLFDRLLRKKAITRKYRAIVHGTLKKQTGTIDMPIGRKENSIIERTVTANGQEAITHYKVKQLLNGSSVVDITLETGRTHQIRVHFAAIGHPLLGDEFYGGTKANIDRHALHCTTLQFDHPITKASMVFHAALPEDMQEVKKS